MKAREEGDKGGQDCVGVVADLHNHISGFHDRILSLENQCLRASSQLPLIPEQKGIVISNLFPNMKEEHLRIENEDKMISYIEMKEFPLMFTCNMKHRYIMVRDCYHSIYDDLKKRLESDTGNNFVISGNPGIGKSYFYLYCIFRLIKDKFCSNKTLLLNSRGIYWIFNGDSFHDVEYNTMLADDTNIIRLIDGDSNDLLQWRGKNVLFASPRAYSDRYFKHFLKEQLRPLYMPVWDISELKNANSLLAAFSPGLEIHDLDERFELVGGVARHVLGLRPLSHLKVYVDSAVSCWDASSLLRGDHASVQNDSSWLLKIVPDKEDDWKGYWLDFQSSMIFEKITKRLVNKSLQDIAHFVVWFLADPGCGTLCGKFYELMFKRMMIEKESDFKKQARALSPDAGNMDIELKVCQSNEFSRLEEIQTGTDPLYYFPNKNHYKSIDGFYVFVDVVYLLQIAVPDRLHVKNEDLRVVFEFFTISRGIPKENLFLLYVVPNCKSGRKIEQKLARSSSDARRRVAMKQFVVDFTPDEI